MSFAPPHSLVVSIHDVSPLTREATEKMLADLQAAGVDRTSLLVIPNHHHRAPVERDPDFAAWLRERREEGHEIVLHGFHHLRQPSGGGVWSRLVTEHYTAGEGEFYDLSREEAGQLMAEGLRVLGAAGFTPAGFIAPAWLLSPGAEAAAREAGFRYTTRLGSVTDLLLNRTYLSQSLVYSVRSGWRRVASLLWNRLLRRRLRRHSLLRLGLHPPDREHEAVWRQATAFARDEAGQRRVTTYAAWVQMAGRESAALAG